ncbi:MAG TPA: ATP-dependent DNA helicase [Gaiellaceae bacterium]|jgi:ATP-dependent DNA helicase DinG|nr:ATP-dependent DNA helicase [Gaiellaceae bacterium]
MESFARLSSVLPGYERRPEQRALADAVERALETGEHLLAEAGTGTGKSLAYLLPALESGQRVVVATATKALQEQLLGNDVPVAAAALGRPVSVAVLKGRQNYLCRKSVQGLALLGGALMRTAEDAAAYERLLPWIESTETGDRAELDEEPSPTLWAELAVGSDRCSGRRCPFLSTCFAEQARDRAGEAELVIANHALYFADVALRGDDAPGVLPEHDAVVFDEAHRLEESAATWLGGRVTAGGIRRFLGDVERACREAEQPAPASALDRVERSAGRLLRTVAPASGRKRLREPPLELALVLVDALASLHVALQGQGEELDALAGRALRLAQDVEGCLDSDGGNIVVWAEPDTLAWAPVDVSADLRRLLWSDGPTAILVSATLQTAGGFRFPRRRLGLDEARELAVGSPYDFGEQALLYVPRSMPDPRAPDVLERVAEEVLELCELSRGRALVLTSSYRALDGIAAGVRGRLPYEVLVQGDAPRERLLERFRDDTDSVLIATSTFWQGVDVPGEALSLLVIDKLPFGAPGDPLVEARCERIEANGGDWFREYSLPTAVLQLRQGFGRLIRGHGDRGVVAILDPRLRTRGYGRTFLEALPRCPLVEDRASVAAFFGAVAA